MGVADWIMTVVWMALGAGIALAGWSLWRSARARRAHWGAVDGESVRARWNERLGIAVMAFGLWFSPLWQYPVGWLGVRVNHARYEPLVGVPVEEFEARTGLEVPRDFGELWLRGWWLAPLTPFKLEIGTMASGHIVKVNCD